MLTIKNIFEKTGNWSFGYREPRNRKLQGTSRLGNRKLVDFLGKYNYFEKSQKSPTILNIIPKNLQKYFLRGMIDGDGCFYSHKKGGNNQFSIAGSYNQDWSNIENIFNDNNINYKLHKQISKLGHKSSQIRISSRNNIKKLNDLIYEEKFDGLGLKRKFDKCQQIIQNKY